MNLTRRRLVLQVGAAVMAVSGLAACARRTEAPAEQVTPATPIATLPPVTTAAPPTQLTATTPGTATTVTAATAAADAWR